MNILIAGATGNTGKRLANLLSSDGHHVIAMHRESSDTTGLSAGAELRQADLTDLPPDICRGVDVVVFAAGSGGDTDEEMTDKVDREGAISLIDIASTSNARRFVMLSSVGAGDPDPDSDLAHYLKAKHDADEHLKASQIEHAIIRPVSLTNEDGVRDIILGDEVDPSAKAHRGDVAAVLARAATQDELAGRTVLMQSA
ncbi:SDR family oxidoreductase [Sphingomicrobium sediminis]|uniref:SDR family oxidoreductase n=1 Tax=Sphingomicrobium sediminis TaxID=2950949 RepID=A0A9X2J269_9SPHN|nr:SDR family oxidoreductase [Sphingomicrobium sediminis]MCM8556720.1 SDR family oxidoreductase [Sphingomicrobium sediminis]